MVTPAQILLVADEYVQLYSRRVRLAEDGVRGYNLKDCKHLLSLWTSITEKGGENLSDTELIEVEGAYASGEYADIWGDPED